MSIFGDEFVNVILDNEMPNRIVLECRSLQKAKDLKGLLQGVQSECPYIVEVRRHETPTKVVLIIQDIRMVVEEWAKDNIRESADFELSVFSQ